MIREFDQNGLDKARFQAEVFEESLTKTSVSSPVFLRRFFSSDYVVKFDDTPGELFLYDSNDAFYQIEKQYGKSNYGKIKYNPEGLYWLGYLTRYICYTRNIYSILLYKLFDVKQIYSLYNSYHTQSEEWCLNRLLCQYGYTEDDLDINKRLKRAIQRYTDCEANYKITDAKHHIK